MKYEAYLGQALQARADKLKDDINFSNLTDEIQLVRMLMVDAVRMYGAVADSGKAEMSPEYQASIAIVRETIVELAKTIQGLLNTQANLMRQNQFLLPLDIVASLIKDIERDVQTLFDNHLPGATLANGQPVNTLFEVDTLKVVEVCREHLEKLATQNEIEGTTLSPDQMVRLMDESMGALNGNTNGFHHN